MIDSIVTAFIYYGLILLTACKLHVKINVKTKKTSKEHLNYLFNYVGDYCAQ